MLCSRVLTPGSSAQRPVPHESVPGHPAQIPRQANEAWWHAALVVATKQRARITSPPPTPLCSSPFQEPDTPTAHRMQAQHAGLVCAPVPGKPHFLCPCGLSRLQSKTAPPMQALLRPEHWHTGAGFAWRGRVERTRRSLHAIAAHCLSTRTVATRDSACPSRDIIGMNLERKPIVIRNTENNFDLFNTPWCAKATWSEVFRKETKNQKPMNTCF
jgi:hypothetical protein